MNQCMFNHPMFSTSWNDQHTYTNDKSKLWCGMQCDNDAVTTIDIGGKGKYRHDVHLCAEHAAYYKDMMFPLEAQYGKELAECRAEQKRAKARKPARKNPPVVAHLMKIIEAQNAQITVLMEEITTLKSKPTIEVNWKSGIVKAREIAFNRNLAKAI